VCVRALFAGVLLSCGGQSNGSVMHILLDILRGPNNFMTSVFPERFFVTQLVKKFLFLHKELVKLTAYPILDHFSYIHACSCQCMLL
jgi:hypothetical protein